jgi:hypothetical protein
MTIISAQKNIYKLKLLRIASAAFLRQRLRPSAKARFRNAIHSSRVNDKARLRSKKSFGGRRRRAWDYCVIVYRGELCKTKTNAGFALVIFLFLLFTSELAKASKEKCPFQGICFDFAESMGFEYALYYAVKSMVVGFCFLIGNRIGI